MAGRFAGCGPPLWLVPSAQRSRRRGHHRCPSLLWLSPLSLLEAVGSDVLLWLCLALFGLAFASPSLRPQAGVVLVGGVGGAAFVVGAAAQRTLQKGFARHHQPVGTLRTEGSSVGLVLPPAAGVVPAARWLPPCAAPLALQKRRTTQSHT